MNKEDILIDKFQNLLIRKKEIETELALTVSKYPEFINDELQKSDENNPLTIFFKPYKDAIELALKNKKGRVLYTDALIFNSNGELLMLLRTAKDGKSELDNKWSLPGGHIDKGETPDVAVIREVLEETNLTVSSCQLRHVSETNDRVIYYYSCIVDPAKLKPTLNATEHKGLEWVNKDKLQNLDCIYDLKEKLNQLFFFEFPQSGEVSVDIKKSIDDAIEVLHKAFDNDQIETDVYLDQLNKAKKAKKILLEKKPTINNDQLKTDLARIGIVIPDEIVDLPKIEKVEEIKEEVKVPEKSKEEIINEIKEEIKETIKEELRSEKKEEPTTIIVEVPVKEEKKEEKPLINNHVIAAYLNNLADLSAQENKKQFYQWQLQNAKQVRLTPLDEIRKKYPVIDMYLKTEFGIMKQSYHNASKICVNNKDIIYVEGFMYINGAPLTCAYNRIDDLYFDITKDLADLSLRSNAEDIVDDCISVMELTSEEVLKYAMDMEGYFSFLDNKFNDENKLEKSEDIRELNYKIEMKSLLDDTYICAYTTTDLQKKHVIEMFAEIKEKGKTKYEIKSSKLDSPEQIVKSLEDDLNKSESIAKIGDTKKWHGREFKFTASGWSHVDNEKNSGLKTEKGKQKLKIQDFTDEELDDHANRSSASELQKIVKEGRTPKLREIAQKHLATRKAKENEHSLYDIMIMEDVEGEHNYSSDENTIHFDKEIDPEFSEQLKKHGIKHKVVLKENK